MTLSTKASERDQAERETIQFHLHESSREARDWSRPSKDGVYRSGARAGAISYARKHGSAGMAWADGRYVLYFMDGGKLRQRTWKYSVYVA